MFNDDYIKQLKEKANKKKATLICASKNFNYKQMENLYEKGITDFGENRANDLLNKKQVLSDLKINWHFIGHLQSNKVRNIINEIDYLHSLDRIKLAKVIQKYRKDKLKCFVQLNLTGEYSKSGLEEQFLEDFLKKLKKYDKIQVIGLMTIGKQNDLNETAYIFRRLKLLAKYYKLKELSMGMTDDYQLALENGATYLRIGRLFLL